MLSWLFIVLVIASVAVYQVKETPALGQAGIVHDWAIIQLVDVAASFFGDRYLGGDLLLRRVGVRVLTLRTSIPPILLLQSHQIHAGLDL